MFCSSTNNAQRQQQQQRLEAILLSSTVHVFELCTDVWFERATEHVCMYGLSQACHSCTIVAILRFTPHVRSITERRTQAHTSISNYSPAQIVDYSLFTQTLEYIPTNIWMLEHTNTHTQTLVLSCVNYNRCCWGTPNRRLLLFLFYFLAQHCGFCLFAVHFSFSLAPAFNPRSLTNSVKDVVNSSTVRTKLLGSSPAHG